MLANPEIEVWLRDRAVNDEDGKVRSVAVQALGKRVQDPQVQALVRDRAVNDKDGSVRRVAERAILAAYPDDPNTLALVQSLNPSGLGFMTAGH